MKHRYWTIPAILVIFLASCAPAAPTATAPAPTLAPATAAPSPQETPTPAIHPLTICAGSEPSDLFLYNDMTYVKKAILSALYDGPIDVVDYGFQPVILTKLPSLADGDAVIAPVQVQEGDQVIDDSGALSALQPGVTIRPAGCNSSDCAVPYQGGTIQMDHLQATFHMRPGVEWTDGAPVNAADSVYSYQVATSPDTLYGNNGLISGSAESVSGTASYAALDDLTTQWTGLPGFMDPNYQTDFFIPLPQHQLSHYTVAELSEANEVLFAPLGWGAYQVTGWDQGKQMTLEPNPHYFRTAEGLPFFNQLTIRFVGNDGAANLAAFSGGQCDILLQDALPATPDATMLDLVNQGTARIYADPQPVFEHLTFDLTPLDPAAPNIFKDPQMRKALAACVDRNSLTKSVYAGLVPPLDLVLPADHPLMAGADLSYPFDPAKAASLLDGLGWKDTNGDGIREAQGVPWVPDGTLLQFSLTTTDSDLRTQVAGLISGQLRACGMDVTVVQSPVRDLFAQNADAALAGRKFELAELSSSMDVETLCGLAGGAEVPSESNGWSGTNLSGYSNPLFDQACATVERSLPGSADYTTSRQTALRIFSEDLPVFPLFYLSGFTLARAGIAGILTGFGQSSELQNIESFKPGP
ncbi:MAG TPA: peptide ABC transporter substrate-binding protein [Anaerolineales bacterium]|nr:peptide ABC transporter substrate-binding protein [Anaerolineales bacterium]